MKAPPAPVLLLATAFVILTLACSPETADQPVPETSPSSNLPSLPNGWNALPPMADNSRDIRKAFHDGEGTTSIRLGCLNDHWVWQLERIAPPLEITGDQEINVASDDNNPITLTAYIPVGGFGVFPNISNQADATAVQLATSKSTFTVETPSRQWILDLTGMQESIKTWITCPLPTKVAIDELIQKTESTTVTPAEDIQPDSKHITEEVWTGYSPANNLRLELPPEFERDDYWISENPAQDWEAAWSTPSGSVIVALARGSFLPQEAPHVNPRRAIHGSMEGLEAAVDDFSSPGVVEISESEYRADYRAEADFLGCETYGSVQVVKTASYLYINQIMVCDHVRKTYDKRFTTAVMDRTELP